MSSLAKIFPYYKYDEWEKWDNQWELIEGIPFSMPPLAVPQHQRIASNLLIEFGIALKKCHNYAIYGPMDYRITDDTIVHRICWLCAMRSLKNI